MIFLSLPGETKFYMSMKKLKSGEAKWYCVKEFLGWNIDTEFYTVDLPEGKLQDLTQLLVIPTTQL